MSMRILALVAAAVLVASSAQANPSVAIKWRASGSSTVASPAVSSTLIADIVLTTTTETVTGVFISIEFDTVELTAMAANELASVSLPGMGNTFSPIAPKGVDLATPGLVLNFEEVTLSTGQEGGLIRTLGSVTFHVVGASNDASDVDVVASLQNAGIDSLTSGATVLCQAATPEGCDFVGASVTPEPTAAVLGAVALATLLGLKRRRH